MGSAPLHVGLRVQVQFGRHLLGLQEAECKLALSSCESEIVAASEAAKEAVYLSNFLKELKLIGDKIIKLFVDNTSARDLAYNPEHHERTKHIDRRHFFVRELVEREVIEVPYVNTAENLADFFTKPLAPNTFIGLRDAIMNIPHTSSPHAIHCAPPKPAVLVAGGASSGACMHAHAHESAPSGCHWEC